MSDDAVLRHEADWLGIPMLGTVQTVVLMKQQGLLPAVKPVLDLMEVRGYHVDPALLAGALTLAGEAQPGEEGGPA